MTSLTVPCISSKAHKLRMKRYALDHDVSMAQMTRYALDMVFGMDFDKEVDVASFFSSSVSRKPHFNTESNAVLEAEVA